MSDRRAIGTVLMAAALIAPPAAAQTDVPLEQQVKAAYLFNFTKFVRWPDAAQADTPLTLCIAGANPFGAVLDDTIRGELVNGRPLQVRVVKEVPGCDVLFVPRDIAHEPLLRAASRAPILTVGEHPEFIRRGGIVNFVLEDGKVRFEIDPSAAARAKLDISSRLLRLARPPAAGTVEDGARPR